MVSLLDRLDSEKWQEKGQHLSEEPPEGYKNYGVQRGKVTPSDASIYQYAAQDDEGKPHLLTLQGVRGKKDPLERIANLLFKVDADNHIVGIVLDDTVFESK